MRISFVGGGAMAEAMVGGILEAKLAVPEDVVVGEPVESRRAYFTERFGLSTHSDNAAAVDGAELVVLAVKPQQLAGVFRTSSKASWTAGRRRSRSSPALG